MSLSDISREAMELARRIESKERWADPADLARLARLVAELASEASSATDTHAALAGKDTA